MEKRQIEITIETATRWLNGSDEELKELALQTFPELVKEELPKCWIDIKSIGGWWVNKNSGIIDSQGMEPIRQNRNVFTTKALAEASINCAVYSQMIKAYREEPLTEFIEIAESYASSVIPMLELFFGKHAENAFYLGLLIQLRNEVNGYWVADYESDSIEPKHHIHNIGQKLEIDYGYTISKIIHFKDKKTAHKFLTDFKKLLIKAKDLI